MASLSELFAGATNDYKQLLKGYPRASKFADALIGNISQNVPTQADFQNPESLSQWATNAALNAPMGLAIKAYHGTPHSFDKFDMSKVGTGEGGQAYGHGLYFAENPATAQSYKDNLSGANFISILLGNNGVFDPAIHRFVVQDINSKGIDSAIENLIKLSKPDHRGVSEPDLEKAAKILEKNKNKIDLNDKGSLYNISLEWPDKAREASNPMGPEHFLDWDKPISQQSPFIQDIINKQLPGNSDKLGEDLYWSLAHGQPASEKSKILREMGIPGLRYLDQGSRKAGEGTSNYVTFSDLIPNIINRR